MGHSLWFKSFFDVYLPKSADAVARKRKLANCACVAFTLQKGVVGARPCRAAQCVSLSRARLVDFPWGKEARRGGNEAGERLTAGSIRRSPAPAAGVTVYRIKPESLYMLYGGCV